jgi:hypothetical protein
MTPDDAAEKFRYHLRRLHRDKGEMPYRKLARLAGISHDPIARALRSGERLPRWSTLEPVIDALGGDVEMFLQLWAAAEDQREPIPRSEEALEADDPETAGDESVIPEPATVEEAQAAQEDLDARIRQQEQGQRSLKEQLDRVREERASLATQIHQLTRQVEQMQQQASLDAARRELLNAQIDALNAQIDALRGEIELRRREIRELLAKLSQYQEVQNQLLEQKLRIAARQWQLAWRYPANELRVLTGHTQVVGSVTFSPDGRLVASWWPRPAAACGTQPCACGKQPPEPNCMC